MIELTSSEIEIVLIWASKAKDSPFPPEQRLYHKIENARGRVLKLHCTDAETIVYWAGRETSGHRGGAWYLLEIEQKLMTKLENFLRDCDDDLVSRS